MNSDLIISLQNYGFSEKEAKVYLTTLELGSSIASTIARRSDVNRVTTYTILNDFKKRGIANEVTKSEVKYFSVISAELLMKQLEQKYESFKSKLPEFLAVEDKFGNKPKVQFFEGLEGIKKMYTNLLTSTEYNIRSFLGTHELSNELKDHLDLIFVPHRVKAGIHAKVILCKSKQNEEYHKKHNKNLIETIVINSSKFSLPNGIDIYGGDKVSFIMFTKEEMSGIIINSKKLHDTLGSIFDFIWDTKGKG